jgi:predicted lipoprotein with Yx(FWY)xxD motif
MAHTGPTRGKSYRGARYRRTLRHNALCLGTICAVALLAAACSAGNASSSSSTTSSSLSPSAGPAAVVKVVTVPTYGQILTDNSGKPLYTLSGSCTGSCASAWPALTVPAGTNPTGSAGVTGALSTVQQADGTDQVTYNGSPLYTFVQDSSGAVTGQGVAGFSVVKVSHSPTPKSSTSTTSSNGY